MKMCLLCNVLVYFKVVFCCVFFSFTWMSSRLERNLITVVTGQAVEAFDRLFRFLYATSNLVDVRQVATEPEPEVEPPPQPAAVTPPSAALARKLYNPKYALVTLGNPSPTPPAGQNSTKETQNPEVPETKKRGRRRASKEAIKEAPPIHPGLTNLEKACLMSYLPIWPEPDPPSDVIGFINIRDSSKPTQFHLQRSEMFETSQAIRFSSPFSMPKETLPEVAKPRKPTDKHEEMNKLQPAQDNTKAEEVVVDRAQPSQLNAGPGDIESKAEAGEHKSPASGPKCESDTTKTLNTENKLHSNTPTNQEAGHNTTPHLNAHAPPQSSSKASSPNAGRPSHTTQTVTTHPQPDSLPGLNTKKEAETSLRLQSAVVQTTRKLKPDSTQPALPRGPTNWNSNTEQRAQTKTMLPHSDSHAEAVHVQPQNSSEMTLNTQNPTVNHYVSSSSTSAMCPQFVSSTSLSENNHGSITTSTATSACAPSSISSPPSLPHLTSSSTTLNPPLPSASASPSLTSTPPIPKPRTIQLVIKDGVISNDQMLPEFSVVRRPATSTGALGVHHESAVANLVQTLPEKELETVPELQNNSDRSTGAQKDAENTGNIGEAPQQKQSGTSHETKNEKAVGLHGDRAGMQVVAGTNLEAQSDVFISDAPKAESVNIQEIIPEDVEPKTLKSIDCKSTPQTDCATTVQTGTKAPGRAVTGYELAEVPNENGKSVTQCKIYQARALELQRISYSELTPHDIGILETVDSSKAPSHTPVSATRNPFISKNSAGESTHTSAANTHGQQANPSLTPAHCTDSMPNTAKRNTHNAFQEQIPKARGSMHKPEKTLHLHLSDTQLPDLFPPTPDGDSRPIPALIRTPTPDGFFPRTPTPDSRIHTPDPRSYTPDFQTPTADVSEGYVSPLSTTSEEYYECSDSPTHESVFDQVAYPNHGTIEDQFSFTHTNTPNATTTTSPAYNNHSTQVAKLGTADKNTSCSEAQSLSGPSRVSSSSSLVENKVKIGEEEETANERNGGNFDDGTERRGSEETKRAANHVKQGKDSTGEVEKNKESQPQAPKRKRALNQSAVEKPVDGVTPGELTSEGAEPKRLTTVDRNPKNLSVEGETPDKEKTVDRVALGPSGLERKDRPLSTRETEGQKLLNTPPRPPRGQQQGSRATSPSRPSRSPRPLSGHQLLGSRPWAGRQLNQAESKVLHSSFQVLDNTSSPCRPPSRPPPPVAVGAVGCAAGRKKAEISHSQQSLLSRQPLTAQGRARAGQSLNPFSKPQSSVFHTHSNMQPHSQNQTVSAREAHCQEEGRAPFSFTFSRLYSLKGLKDKMSKLPAQSKRGSTSSPVQGRKSMS
ncbi:mucin-5AC-like [Micropterus dolomieu]|uniref:mucin-5AC-like n=1 Tax=Micropterus dolomieu TaxID=147949 RepID=UPI001E8E4618|nr:mucin-5AC-like [Micropterus dolomieu]